MSIIFSGIILNNEFLFYYNEYLCMNLFYLYKKYNHEEGDKLLNLLKYDKEIIKILDNYTFETTYNILFENFKNMDFQPINYNKIINIHISIFQIFNSYEKVLKISGLNLYVNNIFIKYSNLQNKLIIRTGVVELRACNVNNIDLINKSIFELSNNINNEEFIVKVSKNPLKCWITTTHDYNFYITSICCLMTNAGFCISNNFKEAINCFTFFKNNYIDAIKNADYLVHWAFLNCFSLDILNDIKVDKKIELINYPSDDDLIKLFDNKNILFITPFKTLIDKQFQSGNIYKLRSKNLTNINLDTIECFVTTYPNKKHKDFIETYNYYISEIDNMFEKNSYNIFTCSCGCYGALLCNYVYKKYNVMSIYIGNRINSFFGISFKNENFENFLPSDLNQRYKNLENVDNNSYGYEGTK